MLTPPHQFEPPARVVRADPSGLERLVTAGLASLDRLADRDLGAAVTDRPTSWVRRISVCGTDVYIKTYDYPTVRDRRRGIGRTTFLARSRAAREADALGWLRAHGFAAPLAWAVVESRRYGWLRRAVLVTEAWPGRPIDQLLGETTDRAERQRLVESVAAFAARLHAAGFRDRNLDLRNLLARPIADGFEIAKIDSPRFRLVRPGRPDDRLARADRARLTASLRAAGA